MAGPNPAVTLPNCYRLIGHFSGNTVGTWRSEWCIFKSAGAIAPGDAIVTAAHDYWIANLRDDCTLVKLEARTVTYGNVPFSLQGALWVSSVGTAGNKDSIYGGNSSVQAPTGLEVCGFVSMFTSGGKPGKQYIRQLLDLVDVNSVAGGEWKFAGGAAHVNPTVFRSNSVNNGLATGYFGTKDPGFVVPHFSFKDWQLDHSTLPFHTAITDYALVRPTLNKPTRKNKL
jgi:hypothetical protein